MLKWKPGPPPVQLEGEVVLAVLDHSTLPQYDGKPVALEWMRNCGRTTFGNHKVRREDVAFHHVLKGKKAHV